MPNCDVEGIRYSVYSFNELADWCNEDLWYGSQARDLSYEAALEELKAEAEQAYVNLLEEAAISAAESGADREPGFSQDDYDEKWFEFKNHEYDKADFISIYMERHADSIQIDEPIIEGVLDGIHYRISWLGGAPLVIVLASPLRTRADLCSPCVPGACNLSSPNPDGYECFDVPPEWKRQCGSFS